MGRIKFSSRLPIRDLLCEWYIDTRGKLQVLASIPYTAFNHIGAMAYIWVSEEDIEFNGI